MKNRKTAFLLLSFSILLFVLVSCDLLNNFHLTPDDDYLGPLGEGQFYAQNTATGKYYIVDAEKLYTGKTCVIWAEIGCGVTKELAKEIAREYDTVIRPATVEMFSMKELSVYSRGSVYYFDDVLGCANWLTGGDGDTGKLTILLLDIKDGYKNPETDPYIAGYFFLGNFFEKGKIKNGLHTHYSNGKDMIYVDTFPGLNPGQQEQAFTTLAHELQHLINYVTSVLVRTNQWNELSLMDTWIDEGLSSQAEYFYLGKNPENRYLWFSADQNESIAKGNNFFVWGNHQNEPMAILDDYATVYLFFRWLYLQTGEAPSFFLDIELSEYPDYRAITKTARDDWEILLTRWLAANYYPKNPGYGYTGDSELLNTVKVDTMTVPSIVLYPGEGVYSIIDGDDFVPGSGGGRNIRYAGLTANSSVITTSSPYTGDILLTFNANTNNKGPRETGLLTGARPSPSPARSIAGNMRTMQLGPYVLDAGDAMRRNWPKDLPGGNDRPHMQLVPE